MPGRPHADAEVRHRAGDPQDDPTSAQAERDDLHPADDNDNNYDCRADDNHGCPADDNDHSPDHDDLDDPTVDNLDDVHHSPIDNDDDHATDHNAADDHIDHHFDDDNNFDNDNNHHHDDNNTADHHVHDIHDDGAALVLMDRRPSARRLPGRHLRWIRPRPHRPHEDGMHRSPVDSATQPSRRRCQPPPTPKQS